MAYFKEILRRATKTEPGKYFPVAVSTGRVTTDDLSDEIADISTVAPPDVVAVLSALNMVIGRHLAAGETVQLKGLCNIRLVAQSKGKGVDNPEDVSADQISGFRVVFSAEQKRGAANKGYALTLKNLRWRPLPGSAAALKADGDSTGNEPSTGDTPDPGNGSTPGGGSDNGGGNNGGGDLPDLGE